jgi:chitin disaccharide deacetylase
MDSYIRWILRFLGIFLFIPFLSAQPKTTAERLGYAPDAKLLLIHADDLALAQSVDRASLAALEKNAVTAGSIMVPCPWYTEIADHLQKNPQADLGIHLTLTSEWKTYRWGPLASRKEVTGLLDPQAYLWAGAADVAQKAKAEEIERELRAQIDRLVKTGLKPSHLDSHMGTVFTPTAFSVYIKLAREYNLPFFLPRMGNLPETMSSLLRDTDVLVDAMVMASAKVPAEKWKEFYIDAVRSLKPGLTEFIVHLAYDDAEMQAIAIDHPDYGSAWRQRDYDIVTSQEFQKAIKDNGVILVGWRDLQKIYGR